MRNHFLIATLILLTLCFFSSAVSVSGTTVLYLGAFACALIACDYKTLLQKIRDNSAAMSFWLLFALFLVGAIYSTSSAHFVFFDIQKRHWLLATPFLMLAIQEDRWRRYMINAFLIAMTVTVALAYLHYFFNINLTGIKTNFNLRSDGVFSTHIVQSFMMSMAAFICAYRAIFQKQFRIIYTVIALLMTIDIIFLSDGRTGYILFFVLALYLGVLRFGWRGAVLTLFSVAILFSAAYFLSSNFHDRINRFYAHASQPVSASRVNAVAIRIEMYHIAKKMIKARPWFGYGTGGVRTALPTVVPENERVLNPSIDFVESVYLNFLLEFGVIGLIVLLTALIMQIKQSFLLAPEYRAYIHAMLLCIFVGGVINKFFLSFPITHLYSLFAAVCFGAFMKDTTKNYPR